MYLIEAFLANSYFNQLVSLTSSVNIQVIIFCVMIRGVPSVRNSGNFRKFQNFISTAHVHDDFMGFDCILLSEKY